MKLAAFMVLLTSCLLTESIGIHALFGAFLPSVFMAEEGAFKTKLGVVWSAAFSPDKGRVGSRRSDPATTIAERVAFGRVPDKIGRQKGRADPSQARA